jgi:glycosyltransferase involved in cell wall biosynthesis
MKKKLKIGFDAKRLFHNNTGLGNYSRNLVKNLKLFYPENEYHLFTPSIKENSLTQFFLENDFIIHECPTLQPKWYWRTYGYSKVINNLELDIFHGLSHEIPFGIGKKTKTIVTVHDLIYEQYPELFGWWNSKIYQYKYRSSCKRADRIFAISNSTAKDISTLYNIIEDNLNITYQSCDEKFQTTPILEKQKNYFLYVGTINKRKSLKDVILAFDTLPNEFKKEVVIVGDGGDYKQEVLNEIKKRNLEKWFVFKGNLSNQQLVEIYDDAICLILPSQYEGFGIPIIESLFRKTPVITCDNSSLPEAVGDGGILFTHGNIEALIKAMQDIQNESKWNQLSINGHEYVKQKYSIETTTKKLFEAYCSIL